MEQELATIKKANEKEHITKEEFEFRIKEIAKCKRDIVYFAEKYFRKGTKVAITGRIQTGSYTNKEGQKVYTTDVVVEEQEFAESKNAGTDNSGFTPAGPAGATDPGDGFMNIPDGIDDELPFN